MITCKPIFFCLIVLFMVTFASGQTRDSLLRLYNNQTLYRYGNNFQKGTERLYFRDLKEEFSISPLGMDSYVMAKKYRTTATVFRVLSLAATVAMISYSSKGNRTAANIAGAGQIVLSLGGIYYQNQSNKQLDRALWQRNKDLLFSQ